LGIGPGYDLNEFTNLSRDCLLFLLCKMDGLIVLNETSLVVVELPQHALEPEFLLKVLVFVALNTII
jgi:hypothetical protein